ncbi:hypothetical protein [Synechococcus sp. PCC 7336]|uniref:hypothetical protein n=1 Tax=Synechococcus sp. PCC 7336 TaxID=195250 RepID=UPI00034DE717|nr:hypothetical protein [Synechococcus sp. PCC 7336]
MLNWPAVSELAIALAVLDVPGRAIVCNSFKDRQYIEEARHLEQSFAASLDASTYLAV